jgi:dihydrofolate reductase
MRKIKNITYVTLDGVMQAPGGGEDFKYAGWTFPYWNDEIARSQLDELASSDALLLGRVTYQGFAASWPSMKDEIGFADKMNSMPKYVVSTTLETADWNNSTLIKSNVADEVTKLKNASGQDILMYGSSSLVRSLIQHDLIDEYRLLVYPIVLGTGQHFFKDESYAKLKLVEAKPFASGVVSLVYQPAPKDG